MNLGFLLPSRSGIPVLMYHKIDPSFSDYLTVRSKQFEEHLHWLKSSGYQSIRLRDFLDVLSHKKSKSELPEKPVLITFDDGYACTLNHGAPLLQRFGMTGVLFLTTGFVGKAPEYLDENGVKRWLEIGNEIALHSHQHPNYRRTAIPEIKADLELNLKWLTDRNLPFEPVLAYPYGARPKDSTQVGLLRSELEVLGVNAAFRIGNRVLSWKEVSSQKNVFEVPRIDIRGEDSMKDFQCKVKKGRIRPFQ